MSPPRSSPTAARAAHTAISRLTLEIDASGGGAQTPGWTGRRSRVPVIGGVRGELPSRLPSTQAEPSRRGPWRPGRSYSGALHLDAMNHARSTVCGSTADGMEAGEGGGPRQWAPPSQVRTHVAPSLRLALQRPYISTPSPASRWTRIVTAASQSPLRTTGTDLT